MKHFWILGLLLLLLASHPALTKEQQLPLAVYTLDNGLTLVVSEDHSAPTFGISVVYHVGFRLEPRGRTGFAHLFEHMMFQGTPEAPKGTFVKAIQGGGGVLNGSTRYDYTNYIASAPVSALEPVLWLEADRMRHLDFSQENLGNQKDVVKEEIRVNVKNKPYGLFFWTDLTALAFDKWENAHDGYGSFVDLDNASLVDVEAFHNTYYSPNNAVISIVGDVDPDQVHQLVKKYFASIPSSQVPKAPDVSEALNKKERFQQSRDKHAQVPAIALGWKMPSTDSQDYFPAIVLGELLSSGDASLLHQELVKEKKLMLNISGGVNWPLGNGITNDGPTLLLLFGLYKPDNPATSSVDAIQTIVQRIADEGVEESRLQAVKTQIKSDFYTELEGFMDRADTLGIAQLLWGDAQLVNRYPSLIDAVSREDIKRVAVKYLTVQNRSWIDRLAAKQEVQP